MPPDTPSPTKSTAAPFPPSPVNPPFTLIWQAGIYPEHKQLTLSILVITFSWKENPH